MKDYDEYGHNYRGKSSSEIIEAKGKRLTSEELQADVDAFLAKKGKIVQVSCYWENEQ